MKIDLEEKCPKCGSTVEWMPVDCDAPWHSRLKMTTAFKIHQSFDAREWAAYFIATLREHPEITINQELMETWFANALMRGYDEREWRTPEYKRMIRRVLHPWWSWKRWLVLALLLPSLGCMNRFSRVAAYQKRATAECEKHHSIEAYKVLPYPSTEPR